MIKKPEVDFFGDTLRVFIAYIQRRQKKNPAYDPHPLVRAMGVAMSQLDDVEVGDRVMGVASDTHDRAMNQYAVVLQKLEGATEVLELRSVTTGQQIDIETLIGMFRLQIRLDQIPQDELTPAAAAAAMNSVEDSVTYVDLTERATEVAAAFWTSVDNGELEIDSDPQLKSILEGVDRATAWCDLPQALRSAMGAVFLPQITDESNAIAMTAPTNAPLPRSKVMDAYVGTRRRILGADRGKSR